MREDAINVVNDILNNLFIYINRCGMLFQFAEICSLDEYVSNLTITGIEAWPFRSQFKIHLKDLPQSTHSQLKPKVILVCEHFQYRHRFRNDGNNHICFQRLDQKSDHNHNWIANWLPEFLMLPELERDITIFDRFGNHLCRFPSEVKWANIESFYHVLEALNNDNGLSIGETNDQIRRAGNTV